MQNFNNPQQPPPQGGFGAPPPPPAKKGMSTGVKILIAVVVVVLIGGVLLLALGVGGYFYLRKKAQEITSAYPGTPKTGLSGTSSSPSSSASDDDAAEEPEPTAAQSAAISGGQSAEWSQQEITWTVPQRWKKTTAESTSFMWSSSGSDPAFLIVSISPMSADFPVDISIKAFHSAAEQRKANGEVNEVKWLKLGGLKGVMFRESAPESDSSPQRLQWMGYRTYKGQVQLVNVMLSSQGKYFARHEDEMYGILYSTEFSQ